MSFIIPLTGYMFVLPAVLLQVVESVFVMGPGAGDLGSCLRSIIIRRFRWTGCGHLGYRGAAFGLGGGALPRLSVGLCFGGLGGFGTFGLWPVRDLGGVLWEGSTGGVVIEGGDGATGKLPRGWLPDGEAGGPLALLGEAQRVGGRFALMELLGPLGLVVFLRMAIFGGLATCSVLVILSVLAIHSVRAIFLELDTFLKLAISLAWVTLPGFLKLARPLGPAIHQRLAFHLGLVGHWGLAIHLGWVWAIPQGQAVLPR